MRTLISAAVIAFGSLAAMAPTTAATIDFSTQQVGAISGPLAFPDATFSSSTGRLFIGAAGRGDRAICPLNGQHCIATLTVSFARPVDKLMFMADGDNSATTSIFVSGMATSGAFSFTAGGFDGAIGSFASFDLSAYRGITRIDITNDDPAGLGYDFFSYTSLTDTSPGSGAVPEPATWALMLSGFGLVGSAMRRRSRPVAVTA